MKKLLNFIIALSFAFTKTSDNLPENASALTNSSCKTISFQEIIPTSLNHAVRMELSRNRHETFKAPLKLRSILKYIQNSQELSCQDIAYVANFLNKSNSCDKANFLKEFCKYKPGYYVQLVSLLNINTKLSEELLKLQNDMFANWFELRRLVSLDKNSEAVQFLNENPVDVNMSTIAGDTLLIELSDKPTSQSHLEIINMLLKRGVDVDMASAENLIALEVAEMNENLEVANILRSRGKLTLLNAVKHNFKDLVEYLIFKRGVDINTQSPEEGTCALHVAVRECNCEMAEFLLKNGANLYLEEKLNFDEEEQAVETPLTIAVSQKDTQMIKLLIKYGLDPRKKTTDELSIFDYLPFLLGSEIQTPLSEESRQVVEEIKNILFQEAIRLQSLEAQTNETNKRQCTDKK